ncbi:MAG: penicillin acylase family protein, partial [Alphaproteobacteria bacterium]
PLLRAAPGVAAMLAPRVPTGGANHTINRGTYRTSGNGRFPHVHGPGLRAIFDMARPGEAMFMIVPGQSGRVASPNYSNLAERWAQGRYIVLKGDLGELRSNASSELTLMP